jgi:hypothetical protein
MSIHTMRAQAIAKARGGIAGNPANADLWNLNKRELVEVALRFGAQISGTPDTFEGARQAVLDELAALRSNGII